MKINTNISLRDRSRITLSGFKGLDTLSAPVEVSAIHATEMQNLISRDGVNHKRFGWKTQYRIRDNNQYLKIQGIFSFTIFQINFLMTYAGYKDIDGNDKFGFYLINEKNKSSTNITQISIDGNGNITNYKISKSPVNIDNLKDNECKCFLNGNKVYFVGCGDFLVFSKWDNGNFELRRVVGNEDVHIPTTTENIGCEEDGTNYTRITAEERNILSPYTKNLLFGKKSLAYTSEDDYEVATYYLDCKNFTDIKVNVKTQGGETVVLSKKNESAQYIKGDKIYNARGEITIKSNPCYTNIYKASTTASLKRVGIWAALTDGWEECPYKDYFEKYNYLVECVWLSSSVEGNFIMNRNKVSAKIIGIPDNPYSVLLGFVSYNDCFGFLGNVEVEESFEVLCYPLITVQYDKEHTLIDMEDGSSLKIKETPNDYVVTLYEGSIYGIGEVVVAIEHATTINARLCYDSNGKENYVGTSYSANYFNNIFDISKTNNIVVSTICERKYKDWDFNLSKYNAVISEIKLGDYYNLNSFKLSGTNTKGNEYKASAVAKDGILRLNAVEGIEDAYAPLTDDEPNIEVVLTRGIEDSLITSSNIAIKFGTLGTTDRLFMVSSNGNSIHWSKDEDFTYFGEKSWCVCGTIDKTIKGLDRLNDSSMLVVKEYSPREPSIFIIKGKIETIKNEAGKEKHRAIFTPYGYQVGMGAVGETVNFNGDCLMVAKDGIYAVSLGENMTVDSRYVLHRSRQISNKLEKFDLSKAKCVSFNGKFFVYVGGKDKECFVADNKYTTSFKGDMQNVVNYEWWRWTNIPVNVWGFVGNELWFGTEDGQLCTFSENFYDETLSRLHTSLAIYETEENEIIGFTLTKDIKVSVGDTFTPTCDFYGGITTDRFECVNDETRFYLPLNDYLENETIYINNIAYTIAKHDLYFSIPYTTELTKLTIYRNYKNEHLIVSSKVEERGTGAIVIKLKDRNNNAPKWSAVIVKGGLNPSNEEFTATLSHKEPVVSKWVSGAMDLGTRAYSKSLTYIVLTGEKDLANRLKYGLKTRFTNRDYELLRANNDLDFTELDLQSVSMDSEFASSYTKRLNIRNVNFLMFYFVSDTAEDISLNSIQIEFKINNRNIGVR